MDSQTNELYVNQSLWNNLIRNNIDKLDYYSLGMCYSRQSEIIELFTEMYKIRNGSYSWEQLSVNPLAIELLTAHQDKINWSYLSLNPAAIELLTANQDKIDWSKLSSNPAAIELLTANQDKINWSSFSLNISNAFQAKKKDDPILTLNNRMMELEQENSLLQLRLENAELKTEQENSLLQLRLVNDELKTEQLQMEFETLIKFFKFLVLVLIIYCVNSIYDIKPYDN